MPRTPAEFEARRTAAARHVFASGDPALDALRSAVAHRLNLLDPESLERMDETNLRALIAEMDEDDAQAASVQVSDEELERQALAAARQAGANPPE